MRRLRNGVFFDSKGKVPIISPLSNFIRNYISELSEINFSYSREGNVYRGRYWHFCQLSALTFLVQMIGNIFGKTRKARESVVVG